MTKIPFQTLIAAFRQMLDDRWGYIPGTAGELWTQSDQDASTLPTVRRYGQQWVGHRVADCSGAFVAAYAANGLKIYHGSNRIAREAVVRLLPAAAGRPGMAAFRIRRPGEAGYALPDSYKPGGSRCNGDLNDYYHIGLVAEDGKSVINARDPQNGFGVSDLSGWDAAAELRDASYAETPAPTDEKRMTVRSGNGRPVNLRSGPGKTYPILAQIPVGETVLMLSQEGDWSCVRRGSLEGYMMTEFLQEAPSSPSPAQHLTRLRQLIEACRTELEEAARIAEDLEKETAS